MSNPKYQVWEITSQNTSRCLTDSDRPNDFNCAFATSARHFPQYAVFDASGARFVATFHNLTTLRQHIPDAIPFKIDGPGKYRRKDGAIVQIFGRNPNLADDQHCWYGVSGAGTAVMTWNTSGQYADGPSDMDLVAKVED